MTLNIAELEARICAESLQLSEQLMNEAFQEIESVIFDRVVSRLRNELPALVDHILQDHIKSKT